jgi:hypothetical protein
MFWVVSNQKITASLRTVHETHHLTLFFNQDGVELGFVGMGLIVVPLLAYTYSRINARRDALRSQPGVNEKGNLSPEDIAQLGDRAPGFRYSL